MTASELILPTRFYTDIFNQHRFDKDCDYDPCGAGLVYPSNELPHFQIKRDHSELTVGNFLLRNVCCDANLNYYKVIPQSASIFASNSGNYWNFPVNEFTPNGGVLPVEKSITELDCGVLKSIYFDPNSWTSTGNFPELTGIQIDNPCRIRFKIVVDKFQRAPGSNMEIRIYNFVTFQSITAPGVYTFDFLSNGNPIVQFAFYEAGDMFEISEIQIQIMDIQCAGSCDTDVILDPDDIQILNLANEKDILVYCPQSTSASVEPGNYYYYVKCVGPGDDDIAFYFSEVFTVVSPRDIQKYYRLKWWNSCDIEDKIIYNQESLNCFFYNQLFLDAGLFKPAYPTLTKPVEDGFGNITEVFRRMDKTKTLDFVAPEFITDAISAAFLHDKVILQDPINKNELLQKAPYQVYRIENTNSSVLNDCLQKNDFIFYIDASVTNTGCCNTIPLVDPGS